MWINSKAPLMAKLSARQSSLWMDIYVYASTTVSFFAGCRSYPIRPSRIPIISIISFRVCAESCIHRGVRYAAIIQLDCLLVLAQGRKKRQPEAVQRNIMHACTKQQQEMDGCRRKKISSSGIEHCMECIYYISSMDDIWIPQEDQRHADR